MPANTPAPTVGFPASGVSLPANYRSTFVHYATVDRIDNVIRDLYINPETADNFKHGGLGYALPDRTIIVIEAYAAKLDADKKPLHDADGHLIKDAPLPMVHVAEKRSDWQASDFVSVARAGQWNFGSFDFNTGAHYVEDLTACFNCHNATPETDFVYSYRLLALYAVRGGVQYSYCKEPDRIAC
jgi:hypothetical protein